VLDAAVHLLPIGQHQQVTSKASNNRAQLVLLLDQLQHPTPTAGVYGGPLAYSSVNLVTHIAFWQSLACARSPYQQQLHAQQLQWG
jgi:hypothetical protein